jgi:hypothetical protein
MSRLAIAAALLVAAPAFAQDEEGIPPVGAPPELGSWPGIWGGDAAITSAQLARDGWKFLAMSTMSWPDGRQAIVTLWQSELGDYARCFDYFDAAVRQTGGKCERSGTGI